MSIKNENKSILINIDDFELEQCCNLKTKKTCDISSSSIGIGFETLDRKMFKPEDTYKYLAVLGAKWARCQTGWNRCELIKGEYDFIWLDEIVDNLLKVGVQPWLSLSFGNKLYMPNALDAATGFVPLFYGEETTCAWECFVTALTKHFKNRISHYEVWNEPNHPHFWSPEKPSAEQYAKLVIITSQAVKKEFPEAIIIGGAMAGFDFEFAESVLLAGAGKYIDKYTYHPYCLIPELGYGNSIDCLRALMDKHAPDVEIWQGENGCPSTVKGHNDDWLGIFNMNETIQAKWAMRRILTDLRFEVEFTSYFHIADLMEQTYIQADGEHKPVMMGLLNGKTYTPKKSFFALRNICSLFDSETLRDKSLFFRQGIVNAKEKIKFNSIVMDSYIRKGFPLYVYYSTEDTQCETMVFKHPEIQICNQADYKINEPVLIDPLTGKIYKITNMKKIEGKHKETNLLNMPVTDYPLIITDFKAI